MSTKNSDLTAAVASTTSTAPGHKRPRGGGGNPSDWDQGRNALIQFLEDLSKILDHLVKIRIPSDVRSLFELGLNDATDQIKVAITQLQRAKTEADPIAEKLQAVGLRGNPLKLKLREFYEAIKSSPVKTVLKFANIILGSLTEAIPPLELVKEFKETVETRLEHGGDPQIISLNLGGTDEWWNR
jgi:hypothetical protein